MASVKLRHARLDLDPERHGRLSSLTTQDVEDAIRRNNLELPAGRIEIARSANSASLRKPTWPRVAQFEDVVLATRAGLPVRLRDVARIEEAAASERTRVRLNGVPAVSQGIIRQATANPLEVSAGVRKLLPEIEANLPPA